MFKKLFIIFCLLFLTATGFGIFQYYQLTHYQAAEDVTLYFEKGSSLKKISRSLAEHKVISNGLVFEILVRLEKKSLKAGEYEFTAHSTFETILDKLVRGDVKKYTFTIPEGYNLKQIGDVLIKTGLTTTEEWQKIISEKPAAQLKIPADSLEGFLFPDTYEYDRETNINEILHRMTHNFWEHSTEIKKSEMPLLQIITLASLIEKETGKAEERPLIASVFFNRLKINMPLQTDPSVIYGIKDFNGNLTRADLQRDTPYNTYTRLGLPPGPICSPGLDALMSVLHPAESQYLYFVAKGDGSHYFSKSLEEHNQAVRYYQLHIGSPP